MYFDRSEYTDMKGNAIKVFYQTFFTHILFPACRLQRFGNLALTHAGADSYGIKQGILPLCHSEPRSGEESLPRQESF